MNLFLFTFACAIVVGTNASAFTKEQQSMVRNKFLSGGMSCLMKNTISVDEIKTLSHKMIPEGDHVSCFLECLLKSVGVMDDMGKLSKSSAMETAKEMFSQDNSKVMKVGLIIDSCIHVNDKKVDTRMCSRSREAYMCLLQKVIRHGLHLDM